MAQHDNNSGLSRFVAEMKRRHVVRFALGYAAAAFVILQLAEIVFPAFGVGEGGLRLLVVLTALGFLPALVLAWVYDITTEGIKRTDDDAAGAVPSRLALGALLITTVGITGAVGLYLADQGVFSDPTTPGSLPPPIELASYDPSQPIRALAVLPLDDYSPDGNQAYFTAGMHEELIAKLSMLDGVRVVSRTTVMKYQGTTLTSPEIGRELGVDALIEGSSSRSGERVRVTLQVIHAPSDSHIQTLQWDRERVDDLLAFQTEIAHAVVHEIEGDHEETMFDQVATNVVPAAQEAYLKGRYEYERGAPEMALEYFQEAVKADPDFANALAGVAGARFLIGLEKPEMAEEELTQAHGEALAAFDMDPNSVEAREVVSLIERSMPRVMDAPLGTAEPFALGNVRVVTMPGTYDSIVVDASAFDTAWVSAITSLGERIEERVRTRSMGQRGPDGTQRQSMAARSLMSSGRYTEAAYVLEDVVREAPDAAPAWEMLARSHIAAGDAAQATAIIERWHDTGQPGAPDQAWVLRLEDAVELEGTRGYWAWTLDRLTMYEDQGERVPHTEIAAAHAALGNSDEAFRYLFTALERGEPGIMSLRSDPVWDDLRDDSRFRRLMQETRSMRFSPTSRSGRSSGRGG